MEYERIHKVQTGIISPSKLRMKLVVLHNHIKEGSNSNSSRTSPSKLEDNEFVNNSLLTSNSGDFEDEVPSGDMVLDSSQDNQASCKPKESLQRENIDVGHFRVQQLTRVDSGNPSMIHPMRTLEEENLDYDSNASSSSFEFHKGERLVQKSFARSYSRPMSSKWNDAEKWIMSRQILEANNSKKAASLNQAGRFPMTTKVKVAPESASCDNKLSITRTADSKRVDFCLPTTQMESEKFSFIPSGSHSLSGQTYGGNALIHPCPQSKDLKEVNKKDISCSTSPTEDTTDIPAVRSVSMRDMGTEMTPATSLEPSRTATPEGATTPLYSPTFSIPSTPRGEPAPTPMEQTIDNAGNSKRELSADEMKLKTRREIVALGVQLGKMNIAAWASKDEKEKNSLSAETINMEELKQIELEKRAAAWEEAENSRHRARCKREEIKIQAWESQQNAKLEAEMRRVEAQVEQMRAQARAKMVKKIAMARQRSEEKRASAEARKNRAAERTAAQAEYIRQTGRMPSSLSICCGWLS